MENVIAYFPITTKPKVKIFDDKSTSIQFYGQTWSQQSHKMGQSRRIVHQKPVHDFRGGGHFLETSISRKI